MDKEHLEEIYTLAITLFEKYPYDEPEKLFRLATEFIAYAEKWEQENLTVNPFDEVKSE